MMNKQNLFLLINFIIMLLVGIGFGLVNQAQTMTEPKDKLFGQKISLEDEQKLSSIPYMSKNSVNFEIVSTKWTAKDSSGETVGYVYHGIIKNDFSLSGSGIDYGFIEVLVGISLDDKIHVEYLNVYQSQWAIVGVQKYIQDYYDGIIYTSVNQVPSFDADIVSGATERPATISTDSIKSIVEKVIDLHYTIIEDNPLIDAYGEGFQVVEDDTFETTDHIVSKSDIMQGSEVVGYMYSVTGSGEYESGSTNSIEVDIYFDSEDKIVLVDLPLDSYNHSDYGTWRARNLSYLENYKGLTISEIQATVDANVGSDITAGASNTRKVIDEILEVFVSEVN